MVDQTTAYSFGGASVAKVMKIMELQNDDRVEMVILQVGTNDVLRNPIIPEARWKPLMAYFLNEQKEKCKLRLVIFAPFFLTQTLAQRSP